MTDTEKADAWPAKDPAETRQYGVNFESDCARVWEKWTDFTTGQRIRVYVTGKPAGFEFEATTGGRSAGRPPSWPETVASIVTDGSITWTCRALSSSSLSRTISGTPTWTAQTGLTVSGESISGTTTLAFISSGTDGQDYSVVVSASLSDGQTAVKSCVLPVRRAR